MPNITDIAPSPNLRAGHAPGCTSSKTVFFSTEAFWNLMMSQKGRRKTKRLLDFYARKQLGTPGGEKSFLRGGQFFKLCPIVPKYVQHIFPVGTKIFLGDASPPPGYGPVDFTKHKRFHKTQTFSQNTNVFLRTLCAFSILV